MFTAIRDAIQEEREVGVPRRFSMGTIFVLMTVFAVLFRLLVLCGAPANTTGVICLFFAAVSAGQMLLFRGARPRAASVIVGAISCPAILTAVTLDELTTEFTGMAPIAAGMNNVAAFISACILLAMPGLGLGYFAGGMVASIFYILGKLVPQLAGMPITETSDEDLSSWDQWLETATNRFRSWFNPFQPSAPIRSAAVKAGFVLLFGTLLAPYVQYMPTSVVMLVALGFAITCIIWSGNEQLWFHWPLQLTLLGSLLGGFVPYSQLIELPLIKTWAAAAIEHNGFNALRSTLWFVGGMVGFTVSGIAGWIQWACLTRRGKQPFGTRGQLGFSMLLVCISLVVGGAIRMWVQSPSQQLFARILDQGGYPQWSSPFSPGQVSGVTLTEQSSDEEFLGIVPLLGPNTFWVQLMGGEFTDASTQAIDGMHLGGLTIDSADLTDAAFSNVNNMSATYMSITNMPVGDSIVADLMKQPRIPGVLEAIDLTGTRVTDASLRALAPCVGLRKITLSRCQISDAGLATLSAFPKLRILHLVECNVTDMGMKTLSTAALALQELNISKTEVSDDGLLHLAKLNRLRILRAKGTEVSQAGVTEFERQRPQCPVSWDGED